MQPLSKFPLFRSSNIDEAHKLIAQHVTPHAIHVIDNESDLTVHFDGLNLDGISIFHVFYGAGVHVAPAHGSNAYFIQTTLDGEGEVVHGNQKCTTRSYDTVIVSPTVPYYMTLKKNCSRLAIKIDQKRLTKYLSGMICEDISKNVVFNLRVDRNKESWLATIDYLLQQIRLLPNLFLQASAKKAYSDLILSNLLETQSHDFSGQIQKPGRLMYSRHMQKALDYLMENLGRPISIVEIAEQSNVSVRTLQRSFVRYTEMTPVQYIHNQRLEAVHRSLLAAGRIEKGYLTRVLIDHGIVNFGQFAASYRKRFGCKPSETLKV